MFGLLIWADKRFKPSGGRLFALYIAAYTAGRLAVETMRVDHANHILGLRLNVWTSIIICAAAVIYFVWSRGKAAGGPQTRQTAESGALAPPSSPAGPG